MNALAITLTAAAPVFVGLCAAVVVLLKRFVAWSEARQAARTFARDFIPECIDVLAQEEALPDVKVTIKASTSFVALEAALALKAAEADALAALDEVAALLADPDVAVKLAVLAEGRAA